MAALVAAGYQVYAINPIQVARYRERHGTSGAKSDRGDTHVLAEIVRLDRTHHQLIAAAKIHQAFQIEHLPALPHIVEAYGASTRALVPILTEMSRQIDAVEEQVVTHFGRHPDGKIYLSQPGLGEDPRPGSSPNSPDATQPLHRR